MHEKKEELQFMTSIELCTRLKLMAMELISKLVKQKWYIKLPEIKQIFKLNNHFRLDMLIGFFLF